MAGATVNLDALIARDDFSSEATNAGGRPRDALGLPDLENNGFFQHSLRKPDFQRETTHWSPNAVYELVKAFLDGDLIPAVIMWERGEEYFVIDGAHRLSALMAWIRDDYGDGTASATLFGGAISPEQKKIADRTRALLRKNIGAYSEFKGLIGQKIADPIKAKWVKRCGGGGVDIQWVTAATPKAAEDSFFKINQAAQPIDPTERRILQTREAPDAIAARCIARGAKGHKYWSKFDQPTQEAIEKIGAELYAALYEPPLNTPVTTSDVPIAGKGYNVLPFVFELVNVANGIPLPTSAKAKTVPDPLPSDQNGEETLDFLRKVQSRLRLVTTTYAGSLGLHPFVYCYSSSGNFQPNAFLAMVEFAWRLDQREKKKDFTNIRRRYEDYLAQNRVFVSLTMSRLGAGGRSLSRIVDLYWAIATDMWEGKEDSEILGSLSSRKEFAHLKQLDIPPPEAENEPSKKGASSSAKSASFIRLAIETPRRCGVCSAALHANSVSSDHKTRVRDGGDNQSSNLQPAHPFCNSGYKS